MVLQPSQEEEAIIRSTEMTRDVGRLRSLAQSHTEGTGKSWNFFPLLCTYKATSSDPPSCAASPAFVSWPTDPVFAPLPVGSPYVLPSSFLILIPASEAWVTPTWLPVSRPRGSRGDFPHFGLGLSSVHPLFPESWAILARSSVQFSVYSPSWTLRDMA